MAGEDTGQEKTFEPTQRKIEQEKEKGNFPRSKEITTLGVFLAAVLYFWFAQDFALARVMHAVAFFLRFETFLDFTPRTVDGIFLHALVLLAPILLPVLLLVFLAGVVSEVAQIGVRAVKDPFEPKWDKLNPASGLKRIFSLRQAVEGLKSVLKILAFGLIAFVTLKQSFDEIVNMPQRTPMQGMQFMIALAVRLGVRTCVLMAFFSGADYLFQRWQYFKKLRMTHQEMKDEQRQQEGDPHLKARMRSIQMEVARRRMMAAVPEADVVVTNPTHYAVALRYDPEKDAAPVLVAKGRNHLARKIRETAEAAGVPLVENAPIARALYKQVEIDGRIPPALFKSVAQILATIWRLAEKRERAWARRDVPRPALT